MPSHELCRPGAPNTVTASARPGGHHTARQMPGCDEPVQCPTGQHKHGTDQCHADHTPPPCIDNLPADQTGSWTPTPNHGHASVTLPGCDPVTVTNCGSGQHYHAPAVPGGHQGCRTAHTAPSCTWNTAGTWTPGHGGPAADGHTTTTGMRVCVSVRHFCIDSGSNILAETVDRQTGVGAPDDRGLLPAGYHRDRIPHSTNLQHTQFLPRLTLGGQLSPTGRSRIPAGEWVTATAATTAPAAARTIAAESYDYDNNRWRNCGRLTFQRTGLTWRATGHQTLTLDTTGKRITRHGEDPACRYTFWEEVIWLNVSGVVEV